MPDTGPTSERLEALRGRWDSDKGSRVFLQLADEYRRLGRAEDAVRVLQEGLAENPRYPAALVALGRCQLELGRSAEAVEALERVVESDPTQMVAYRLLVDAYIAQGKPEEARQRLRVYGLLNDADPEIAELRRRIGEIERRARTESPFLEPEEPGSELPIEAEPEPAEERPAPEPFESPPAEIEAGAGGESYPAQPEPGEPPREPEPEVDGDPFPALADPAGRRRYLETLARDGLFDLGVEPEPEPEPEPFAEPEAEATSAPGRQPAWQPAPEPPAGQLFDLEPAPAAGAPDLASLLDPAPAAATPAEAPGRPTVTLGRLYLRQGHRLEAEAIFREVLERDPGNAEARRHLDDLASAGEEGRQPALEASELLAGWQEGDTPEEGLTRRKRYVLERYLDRLRGRSSGDVH